MRQFVGHLQKRIWVTGARKEVRGVLVHEADATTPSSALCDLWWVAISGHYAAVMTGLDKHLTKLSTSPQGNFKDMLKIAWINGGLERRLGVHWNRPRVNGRQVQFFTSRE